MNANQFSKRYRHFLITVIIGITATVILAILFKGLYLNPSIVRSTLIGKPAQEFEVEVLEGASWLPNVHDQKIKLSDLKGRTVILNFWASWCVSCAEEARHMEQFWQRYREKGIIILGVAIQDTPEAAREFAKRHGKTYPIGLDVSGKTSIDYGVYGVPETFVINKEGVITHKEAGPVTTALLESFIN